MILAGHSMGGIAITQAAENCPKHIGALVVNPTTTIPRDDGTIAFKPEHSREAFYGDCTDEDAAFAQSRLGTQSAAPFGTPVENNSGAMGSNSTLLHRVRARPRYHVQAATGDAEAFSMPPDIFDRHGSLAIPIRAETACGYSFADWERVKHQLFANTCGLRDPLAQLLRQSATRYHQKSRRLIERAQRRISRSAGGT